MIKNIIFDFGDVFINLDKAGAHQNALTLFNTTELPETFIAINSLYEEGHISTEEFLEFYVDNFPELSHDTLIDTWNSILKDFPEHRLEFLQKLATEKTYKLILLSNTNDLHISWIQENIEIYEAFKACFDGFYLSHEINLRKPNASIYQYIIEKQDLIPEETLFIDDTEDNILSAQDLGIHTWHIDETSQDITQLFEVKKSLF